MHASATCLQSTRSNTPCILALGKVEPQDNSTTTLCGTDMSGNQRVRLNTVSDKDTFPICISRVSMNMAIINYLNLDKFQKLPDPFLYGPAQPSKSRVRGIS